MRCRSIRSAIIVLSLALGATDALGQAKLPDAWFFPDRPAGLKGLEGKPTPQLKLKEWIGDKVNMADTKGKVVVIDFWATWCGPCMASIPHNVEVVKKYKDQGLVFIGVHDANSGWDQASGVVKSKNINYPVAKDEDGGLSAKAFNLAFWPTYVVIDRAGVVRGAGLAPNNVEEAVKMLLAEPAPAGTSKPKSQGPPDEWFVAGAGRPAALRAVEGKPMPPLDAANWVGEPLSAAETKDRVIVLHFMSAGNRTSMIQAQELAKLEKELGPQGVVVIGVVPSQEKLEVVQKLAADGKIPARTCQEAPSEGKQPAGVTGKLTGAFGVRYLPATVIVDRAGVVRAAGVRIDRVREITGKLLAESVKPPTGG